MRFAYADPPYHGLGRSRYGYGEWDDKQAHLDLVARLVSGFPDGWALSCNPRDLRWLLSECPEDARVGAWVKTWHQIRPTTTQYAWEAVIWRGGRSDPARPMVRDWLSAAATRQRGLVGAKPEEFCRWVLLLLGFRAGDEIVDLFPGTGVLGRVAAQGAFAI